MQVKLSSDETNLLGRFFANGWQKEWANTLWPIVMQLWNNQRPIAALVQAMCFTNSDILLAALRELVAEECSVAEMQASGSKVFVEISDEDEISDDAESTHTLQTFARLSSWVMFDPKLGESCCGWTVQHRFTAEGMPTVVVMKKKDDKLVLFPGTGWLTRKGAVMQGQWNSDPIRNVGARLAEMVETVILTQADLLACNGSLTLVGTGLGGAAAVELGERLVQRPGITSPILVVAINAPGRFLPRQSVSIKTRHLSQGSNNKLEITYIQVLGDFIGLLGLKPSSASHYFVDSYAPFLPFVRHIEPAVGERMQTQRSRALMVASAVIVSLYRWIRHLLDRLLRHWSLTGLLVGCAVAGIVMASGGLVLPILGLTLWAKAAILSTVTALAVTCWLDAWRQIRGTWSDLSTAVKMFWVVNCLTGGALSLATYPLWCVLSWSPWLHPEKPYALESECQDDQSDVATCASEDGEESIASKSEVELEVGLTARVMVFAGTLMLTLGWGVMRLVLLPKDMLWPILCVPVKGIMQIHGTADRAWGVAAVILLGLALLPTMPHLCCGLAAMVTAAVAFALWNLSTCPVTTQLWRGQEGGGSDAYRPTYEEEDEGDGFLCSDEDTELSV